jgi:hypothetical protein
MILAGAAADHYSPAWVIAVSGTVGAAVALAIAVSWAGHRMQSTDGYLQRLGVSPSGCRAWRAAPVVGRAGGGYGLGSAPVGVAHGVLLPFSVWLDSLRNHVNAPVGDAVRPRALAVQGVPLRRPHPAVGVTATHCGSQLRRRGALYLLPGIRLYWCDRT